MEVAIIGIKEGNMPGYRWIGLLLTFMILTLCGEPLARVARAEERVQAVMGVVEFVHESMVTVAGKTFDLKGVPIRSARDLTPVNLSALEGRTVEILLRNRLVQSVTVYPTLPQ